MIRPLALLSLLRAFDEISRPLTCDDRVRAHDLLGAAYRAAGYEACPLRETVVEDLTAALQRELLAGSYSVELVEAGQSADPYAAGREREEALMRGKTS